MATRNSEGQSSKAELLQAGEVGIAVLDGSAGALGKHRAGDGKEGEEAIEMRAMSEAGQLARFLSANPLFVSLGEPTLQAVARLCVTRSLGAQEILFQKNDLADALYAVRRGEIRIATGTEEGRELTLNLLGPGDVFGEIAILDGSPRTADAIATEPTELLVIHRRDMLDLLSQQPDIAIAIIELLCKRVRWMSERMEETSFLSVPARLSRRLTALADDYGDEIHVTQEALAVFANTTRETVNRQLQAWKRDGLVELGRNRIRLLDRAAIDTVAEADGSNGRGADQKLHGEATHRPTT